MAACLLCPGEVQMPIAADRPNSDGTMRIVGWAPNREIHAHVGIRVSVAPAIAGTAADGRAATVSSAAGVA